VYLVYIDESGDPGYPQADGSGTVHYTLSAVVVHDKDWLHTLNQIIAFRKFLQRIYGLKMRDELKASYLIHNSGPIFPLNLSEKSRLRIYRKALEFQRKLGNIITWAIVIDKVEWENKEYKLDILAGVWKGMIERLERFTTKLEEPCMVIPDQGNERQVTGLLRRMRRFSRPNSRYDSATLKRNAILLLEDPNFRESQSSYFVQFADLNAYAATRSEFPKSWFDGKYWDYLGDCRNEDVNKYSGGTRGIARKP